MTTSQEKTKKYALIFKKYPIIAAYLFGSRAKKAKVGPLSDYDFGIQISKKVPETKYSDIQIQIATELMHTIHCNKTDVVVLNNAPLLLKHQIISTGKLIYNKEPAERALMVFDTLAKYLDWQYFENLFSTSLIKKVAEEGLNV
jgi:predicted nucleotidyltransferase